MSRFRTSQAADLLGVSVDTIRRWADEGRLATTRTAGGHREIDGGALARLLIDQRAQEPSGAPSSARNRFTGLVTRVDREGLTAIVELQCGPHRVVSLMTSDGADELDLAVGDLATAVVKATTVIVERSAP